MSVRYYDKSGMEIGYEDYVYLRYDSHGEDYKRVAETEIETENVWISTVWLGLDHGYGMDGGDPLIFETMVFAVLGDGVVDMGGIWTGRSSTLAEAESRHEIAVEMAYSGYFREDIEDSCRKMEESEAEREW